MIRRTVALLGLALMVVAAYEVYVVRAEVQNVDVSPEEIQALKGRLEQLPETLAEGRFLPIPYEVNREMVEQSGADTFAARGYRDLDGHVYRVYLGGAIRNKESFHAPNYCMPAQGWEILSQTSVPSPMTAGGSKLRRLDLRLGNERMLVYYWFQCGRRQTDHDLVARWYRFLDFISNSLDTTKDAKLQPTMIATIYVPYAGTVEDAVGRTETFLKQIGPALLRAVDPGEN